MLIKPNLCRLLRNYNYIKLSVRFQVFWWMKLLNSQTMSDYTIETVQLSDNVWLHYWWMKLFNSLTMSDYTIDGWNCSTLWQCPTTLLMDETIQLSDNVRLHNCNSLLYYITKNGKNDPNQLQGAQNTLCCIVARCARLVPPLHYINLYVGYQ